MSTPSVWETNQNPNFTYLYHPDRSVTLTPFGASVPAQTGTRVIEAPTGKGSNLYIAGETITVHAGTTFSWPGREVVIVARQIIIADALSGASSDVNKVIFDLEGADGALDFANKDQRAGTGGKGHDGQLVEPDHHWYDKESWQYDFHNSTRAAIGSAGIPGSNADSGEPGGSLILIGEIVWPSNRDISLEIRSDGGKGGKGQDGGDGGPGGNGAQTGNTWMWYKFSGNNGGDPPIKGVKDLIDGKHGGSGANGGNGGNGAQAGHVIVHTLTAFKVPTYEEMSSIEYTAPYTLDAVLIPADKDPAITPPSSLILSAAPGLAGGRGEGGRKGKAGEHGHTEQIHDSLFGHEYTYGHDGADGDNEDPDCKEGSPGNSGTDGAAGSIDSKNVSDWKGAAYKDQLVDVIRAFHPTWLLGITQRLQFEMQILFGLRSTPDAAPSDEYKASAEAVVTTLAWLGALRLVFEADDKDKGDGWAGLPSKCFRDTLDDHWFAAKTTLINAVDLLLASGNKTTCITATDMLGNAYDWVPHVNLRFDDLEKALLAHNKIANNRAAWDAMLLKENMARADAKAQLDSAQATLDAAPGALENVDTNLANLRASLNNQYDALSKAQKTVVSAIDGLADKPTFGFDTVLAGVEALSTVLMFVASEGMTAAPVIGSILNVGGSMVGSARKSTIDTVSGDVDPKYLRGEITQLGAGQRDSLDDIAKDLKTAVAGGKAATTTITIDRNAIFGLLNRYFTTKETESVKVQVRAFVEQASTYNETVVRYNNAVLARAQALLHIENAKATVALIGKATDTMITSGQCALMSGAYSAFEAHQRHVVLEQLNATIKELQLITLKPSTTLDALLTLNSWSALFDVPAEYAGSDTVPADMTTVVITNMKSEISALLNTLATTTPAPYEDVQVILTPESHPWIFTPPDAQHALPFYYVLTPDDFQKCNPNFNLSLWDYRLIDVNVFLVNAISTTGHEHITLNLTLGGNFYVDDVSHNLHLFKTETKYLDSSYSYQSNSYWNRVLGGNYYDLSHIKMDRNDPDRSWEQANLGAAGDGKSYPAQGIFRSYGVHWNPKEVDISSLSSVIFRFKLQARPGASIVAANLALPRMGFAMFWPWSRFANRRFRFNEGLRDFANEFFTMETQKTMYDFVYAPLAKHMYQQYDQKKRQEARLKAMRDRKAAMDKLRESLSRIDIGIKTARDEQAKARLRSAEYKKQAAWFASMAGTLKGYLVSGITAVGSSVLGVGRESEDRDPNDPNDPNGPNGTNEPSLLGSNSDDAIDPGLAVFRIDTQHDAALDNGREATLAVIASLPHGATILDPATSATLLAAQDSQARRTIIETDPHTLRDQSKAHIASGQSLEGCVVVIGQDNYVRIDAIVPHPSGAQVGNSIVLQGLVGEGTAAPLPAVYSVTRDTASPNQLILGHLSSTAADRSKTAEAIPSMLGEAALFTQAETLPHVLDAVAAGVADIDGYVASVAKDVHERAEKLSNFQIFDDWQDTHALLTSDEARYETLPVVPDPGKTALETFMQTPLDTLRQATKVSELPGIVIDGHQAFIGKGIAGVDVALASQFVSKASAADITAVQTAVNHHISLGFTDDAAARFRAAIEAEIAKRAGTGYEHPSVVADALLRDTGFQDIVSQAYDAHIRPTLSEPQLLSTVGATLSTMPKDAITNIVREGLNRQLAPSITGERGLVHTILVASSIKHLTESVDQAVLASETAKLATAKSLRTAAKTSLERQLKNLPANDPKIIELQEQVDEVDRDIEKVDKALTEAAEVQDRQADPLKKAAHEQQRDKDIDARKVDVRTPK